MKGLIAGRLTFGGITLSPSSGDKTIYAALQALTAGGSSSQRDLGRHLDACRHISQAMPLSISIDNFIDACKDSAEVKMCAKLAIIQSILAEERQSPLFVDPYQAPSAPNWNDTVDSWFNGFFRLLTENCPFEDLPERLKLVALIIFNYDRCVEHFLFHALQTYYGVGAPEAAKTMAALEIYHPYGFVGPLPWQTDDGSIEFGQEAEAEGLVALSSQIQTFSEGTDPTSSQITRIRDHFSQAQILVFLGFAFHQLNLNLLRATEAPKKPAPQHDVSVRPSAFPRAIADLSKASSES